MVVFMDALTAVFYFGVSIYLLVMRFIINKLEDEDGEKPTKSVNSLTVFFVVFLVLAGMMAMNAMKASSPANLSGGGLRFKK